MEQFFTSVPSVFSMDVLYFGLCLPNKRRIRSTDFLECWMSAQLVLLFELCIRSILICIAEFSVEAYDTFLPQLHQHHFRDWKIWYLWPF